MTVFVAGSVRLAVAAVLVSFLFLSPSTTQAAPVTTITAAPADPSTDSGAVFEFSSALAASFRCRLDGGDWLDCTSPARYQLLMPGPHSFTVAATDAEGVAEVAPVAYSWQVTALDGACGSASGTTLTAAPTSDLCAAGTASSVTGSGPWSWTCAGANGGTDAACSAGASPVFSSVSVAFAGSGAGSVSSSPAGVSCSSASSGSCSAQFLVGDTVTLSALAASNASFVGWSGACSGTGPCTFQASAATTVTATFNRVSRAAELLYPENGATLAAEGQLFRWSDSGAEAYQLWLGTAPGAYSVAVYPLTTATTLTGNGIPADGKTIHARLWSKIDGQWQHNDYTFTAGRTIPGWRFPGGDSAGTGFVTVPGTAVSGGFAPTSSFPVPTGAQLRSADLTGDGRQDLVAVGGDKLRIRYGDTAKGSVETALPFQAASVILADLDLDGLPEILIGSQGSDVPSIAVFSGDGSLLRTILGREAAAGASIYPVALQGDGILIVQYDADDPSARGLAAIDTKNGAAGSELWFRATGLRAQAASAAVTGTDGELMLLPFATRPGLEDLAALASRYTVDRNGSVTLLPPQAAVGTEPPCSDFRRIIVDLDGVGAKEILAVAGYSDERPGQGYLAVSDLSGNERYRYPLAENSTPRVVVARTGVGSTVICQSGQKLELLDPQLAPLRSLTLPEGAYLAGAVETDGDGVAEILVASGRLLQAFRTSNLEELWSVQLDAELTGSVIPSEVDGDGRTELVATLADGRGVLLEGGARAAAALLTPSAGAVGASQLFTWTNAGSARYQLWIGTQPGYHDLGAYPESSTSETSVTAPNLPTDGRMLFVRLWTYVGGGWHYHDYSFTTEVAPAALLSPSSSTTLAGASETFTWNNSGADYYQLWLGSSPGGVDIGCSALTRSTSSRMEGVPTDGRTVYARLWSLVASGWIYQDYSFTASGAPPHAAITQPPDQSTLAGTSQQFSWNDWARLYQLWLGSSEGSYNLGVYPSMQGTTATSVTVDNLPNDGRVIHARLWYLVGSTWRYTDYSYTADATQFRLGATVQECSLNKNLWVIDIGSPETGVPWLTQLEDPQLGTSFRFSFNSSSWPESTRQQADVAFGGGNPNSRGSWDMSAVRKISLKFKDLNLDAVDADGFSTLNHYLLVYDKNFRYHEWFLDEPEKDGSIRFRPGEWTEVSVDVSSDPSTFFKEGGDLGQPMDYSNIVYVEMGVFGPNVKPLTLYSFEVAGLDVDAPAPTLAER